jgi:glyoxylase-like metal-dependent hydrolase (beta-lactamase superfamily II)
MGMGAAPDLDDDPRRTVLVGPRERDDTRHASRTTRRRSATGPVGIVGGMQEILPGVYHWTSIHPKLRIEVASYWLDGPGVVIDPLIPADVGIEWFAGRRTPPTAVLLSNRHHFRHSDVFAAAFGCAVHANAAGLHEFTHGEVVEGFAPGDALPGGVTACEVGIICPDETALFVEDQRAMVFADALVTGAPHHRQNLGFVPDQLMDDPVQTKLGLLQTFARLLDDYDFAHLLLAHGGPIIGDGRRGLQELISAGGRTAFEM